LPPDTLQEAADDGPAASPSVKRGAVPRLAISLGQSSSAGRKSENQDFHGALEPEGADLATKGIAVAIADGISTSRLGATAAETAVKSFLTDYYCTSEGWSVRTAAERVIAAANSWMHAQNRAAYGRPLEDGERELGLVCTFTAMVLKSRSAHLLHVGDARIARCRNGTIEPLTEAHRVNLGGGETYLGRALGVNRHVEIDYRRLHLEVGDIFVLSTDGVHEFLPDMRMARLLGGEGTLDDQAGAIAEAALDNGSEDNLTVQIVRIESLPNGEISDLVGAEAGLPPAPRLEPGQQFAGYSVLRELHSGSRSHVYLARDEADGRKVALKAPSTEHGEDTRCVQELLLEEWVMRRLDHPNLLKAAPSRGARSHAFAVSEYVEGQTLRQWMFDHPQPELEAMRAIVKQIASGLQAMHRREMLHRDLRPHNVLIDADGAVRIIDFGSVQVAGLDELAPAHTIDAIFAGTMQYSAPELYLGQPATGQSDLYSLGVIAYQLLTGELPYGPRVANASTRQAQRRLRYVPASELNPEIPEWVDAALAKAVAVDPRKRYEELSEFTYDLANPNSSLLSPEPRPLAQRNPLLLWQAIAFLLAVALAISIATRPEAVTPEPTPQPMENAR